MTKLSSERQERILEKLAKIPGWAKAFARQNGSVVTVTKWPRSKRLIAKLKMLQNGRLNAPLYRGGRGHIYGGGPAKPKGGWPKGSAMDRWVRDAGRRSK